MRDIFLRIEEEEEAYHVVVSESQRKQFNFAFAVMTICSSIFGMACWVGVAWFFVWAAVGGWRVVHQMIEHITTAIK